MIKKLIDIVLFTSLFISFGASAIVLRTYYISGNTPDWGLVTFIFFSTLFTYNLTKVIPIWSAQIENDVNLDDRHLWNIKNKELLVLITIISLVFSGYFVFGLGFRQQIFLVHLGLISGLYAMPIFTGKPLRALPLLKVFLIAYVWAATSILPFLEFSELILKIALENFFFILAITIPFDIRDYTRDQAEGVITIPYKFGVKFSKIIALVCLLVSSVFSFMVIQEGFKLILSITLNLIFIPILFTSSEKRGEYFYLGIIDGLIIIRLLIFII